MSDTRYYLILWVSIFLGLGVIISVLWWSNSLAQDMPPDQPQAISYQIGNPDRFGNTPVAQVFGMTYAQPVECSPAMTSTGTPPLFCGVHPVGEDALVIELKFGLRGREPLSQNLIISDGIRVAGHEHGMAITPNGFFYVMPPR